MFSKKLLIPLLSLSLLVTPAYSSHAAENAEAAGTSVEGQGMLSPSSSSESSESVFNGSGAGTSSEPVTDEKLETILKQVQSQLPTENGTWAVFISDLINGTEGSLNDQKMQAASLIKLYIMGAVYENYDQITGQYGRDSVDSNLYSMITVSDNDAANTLTTYLGGGDSAALRVCASYELATRNNIGKYGYEQHDDHQYEQYMRHFEMFLFLDHDLSSPFHVMLKTNIATIMPIAKVMCFDGDAGDQEPD